MLYHVWQRVELFHNGKWYQAHVAAVDEESADSKRCYRIKFEENNPAGTSSSMQTIRYTTILIPIKMLLQGYALGEAKLQKKRRNLRKA